MYIDRDDDTWENWYRSFVLTYFKDYIAAAKTIQNLTSDALYAWNASREKH